MFKLNIKHTIILLIFAVWGCKEDFLEVTPKGRLIATTVEDYSRLLTNRKLIVINTDAQIPMGDELTAIETYFRNAALRTQRLFRWDPVIYDQDIDAVEMNEPMANIYLYNKVINEVMEATGGSDSEKRWIMAQAKAGRAWTYFLMINYYGLPYAEATAANNPGFPIVRVANVMEDTFERNSVKEVYEFIVQDLLEAIPDLMPEINDRVRPSRSFAEGLLGKVYMYMGCYQDALPLLQSAIHGLSQTTIPAALYDYNETFAPGGSMDGGGMFGPPYPTTINLHENIFSKQAANDWTFGRYELVISEATVALYDSVDFRLNFYDKGPLWSPDEYPNGMLRRVGPGVAQMGMMVSDLYLLQAETKARLNDLLGATEDLVHFRKHRLPPGHEAIAPVITNNRIALITYILEERIREFALQGDRWFDMRRLSVDEEFKHTVGYTHNVVNDDGEVMQTYELKPERLVLRFTEKLMRQNPGMVNNP
ncbi:RagB/SusD family nutrient uptake outer membrane protein [Sphingobacterium psychroaquaticum]|uniref:RagB/SusD family nutrient uptake outer membrane protein n=1 Tax=Sphingobacterium psychroaquaticum TaxID=561061 RepID=UPI00106CDB23|nr:RagB/SusD family nutrient uptake outer membrane protein [Sphingobacterium psychroaquaticum]QBQ40491.1 RagB/SusD family nutrient uptake outer membrane protein [Sphingobacterium psychroaquaticum]